MSLTSFLKDLFDHGRVATSAAEASAEDQQGATRVLREFERYDRAHWPGEPPEFSEPIGLWSAKLLYCACHFVVERDANSEFLRHALAVEPPAVALPAAHYSADLLLRFLPDVARLARAAAEADPLITMLIELGRQWPLASVGMRDVGTVDVRGLVQHPCLLQAYVDRVIRRPDISRLSHPAVRQAVQAALGCYSDLAPAISSEIERLATEEPTR